MNPYTLLLVVLFAASAGVVTEAHAQIANSDSLRITNNSFDQELIHLTGNYYVSSGFTLTNTAGPVGTAEAQLVFRLYTIIDGDITLVASQNIGTPINPSATLSDWSIPSLHTSLVRLSDTRIAVVFDSGGSNNLVTYTVDTSSATPFTRANSIGILGLNARFFSLIKFDDNRLALVYTAAASQFPGQIRLFDLGASGDGLSRLTNGDRQLPSPNQYRYNSMEKIDDNTVAIGFRGQSAQAALLAIDVSSTSGTTVDNLATIHHTGIRTAYHSLVRVDDDTLAVAYSEIGASGATTGGAGHIRLFDLNGRAFTQVDTATYYDGGATRAVTEHAHFNSLVLLDSDTLAVAYRGADGDGFIRVYNIVGTGTTATLVLDGTFEHDPVSGGSFNEMLRVDDNTLALMYSGSSPTTIGSSVAVPSTIKTITVGAPTVTTTPTVTSVTAPAGEYSVGEGIPITVTFSEDITVTGTPQLVVNVGGTDVPVTLDRSTATTLVFRYTVAAGHNTANFNYAGADSLSVTGGTIVSADDSTAADLTLPATASNSLASTAITIDSTAPTAAITSTTANSGQRTSAQSISYAVAFSEDIEGFDSSDISVTGTAGGSSVSAVTRSGADYIFDVDVTSDGTVIVSIPAGTLTDTAGNGNTASNTHTITVDTAEPTVTISATTPVHPDFTNAAIIPYTVTFSQAVTGFVHSDISVSGTASGTVSGFTGSGSSYTFNVDTISDGAVIVTIAANAAVNGLDVGNAAADVHTLTRDTVAPAHVSAQTTSDTEIEITTSEAVFGSVTSNEFTVTGKTTTGIGVSDSTITVTVSEPIISIEDPDVTYTGSTITDLAGNVLPGFTLDVTNNVPAVPTVISVSATDGPYRLAGVIRIVVTFDEPVTVSGIPQIRLNIGGTLTPVDYTSGSPGTALEFHYTVPAGVNEADLNYFSTTSLVLNGGTIVASTGGATAVLTLPELTSDDSLGGSDIVIDTIAPIFSSAEARFDAVITVSEQLIGTTGSSDFRLEVDNGGFTDITLDGVTLSGDTVTLVPDSVFLHGEAIRVSYTGSTLTDAAGNALVQFTNQPVTNNVPDTTAPTVVIAGDTVADGSATNTSPISYTATFSETVTGFDSSDITLGGTATATVGTVAGSGTTYTFAVTATRDGTIEVSIPADAAIDGTSNGNTVSEVYTVTIDTITPTFISAGTASSTTIDVIASEPLAGTPAIGSFSVSDNTVSAAAISGNTLTITVGTEITSASTLRVGLTGASVTDLAGSALVFTNQPVVNNVSDATNTVVFSFGSAGTGNAEFDRPAGIAITPTQILVADLRNDRIQIFDHSGNYVSQFGSFGTSGNARFDSPEGVAANSTHILVTDTANHRIQTFDLDGNYVSQFGSEGSGDDQFNAPRGIAVNSTHIFVADTNNVRIQIFDLDGNHVRSISPGSGNDPGEFRSVQRVAVTPTHIVAGDAGGHRITTFDHSGNYVSRFGSFGTGSGEFNTPRGVAVTATHILVADSVNNRVQIFDHSGNYQSQFSDITPWGIAVSGDNVFVPDDGIDRVTVLSLSALLATADSTAPTVSSVGTTSPTTIVITASEPLTGTATQSDFTVHGNTVSDAVISDSTITLTVSTLIIPGNVLRVSYSGDTVTDLAGNALASFTPRTATNNVSGTVTLGTISYSDTIAGFNDPEGVAVTSERIFVADTDANQVKVFDLSGNLVNTIGTGAPGVGNDQFNTPTDVATNATYMFVLDSFNQRVQILRHDGTYSSTIGTTGSVGSSNNHLRVPSGLTLNSTHIFVADSGNHRLQIFDLSGNYADTIGTGAGGDGNDNLAFPNAVTVNSENIFVTESDNRRVHIFTHDGTHSSTIGAGTQGNANNQFNAPSGITHNSTHIFVADTNNHRVQIFTPDGTLTGTVDSRGSGNGQFNSPFKMATNSTHLFVADRDNDRIQIFELDADLLTVEISSINADNDGATNVQTVAYTVRFSGTVTDFALEDITVTGTADSDSPTASNLAGSGDTYTFDVVTATDGTVVVSILADAATAAAGNGNLASNTYTITVDATAPTAPSIRTTSSTTIDIVASEPLKGTPNPADFTLRTDAFAVIPIIDATISDSTVTLTTNTQLPIGTLTLELTGNSVTDLAGNALVLSRVPVAQGTFTTVTVTSVATTGGPYNEGDTVPITVTFSDSVTVTGTPQLTLETGATDAVVDYTSGSPGTALLFNYVVAAGHSSTDLNYVGTDSLSLNSGTIVARTDGAAAVLTLPAITSANSLGGSDVVIDTIAPTVSSAETTSETTIVITASESLTGTSAIVNDITVSSNTVSTATISGNTITIEVGTPITSTDTVTVELGGTSVTDSAGNTFTFAARTVTNNVPSAAPTVTSVSATDDTYGVGVSVPITVIFSELVTVTGTPLLALNVGGTTAQADYVRGSPGTDLVFGYTVTAGINTADFNYIDTDSLTGTIVSAAGTQADLTLPATTSTNSLLGSSVIIDTIEPTVRITSTTANDGETTNSRTISYAVTFGEDVADFEESDVRVTGSASSPSISSFTGSGTSYTFNVGTTSDGTVIVSILGGTVSDDAGNVNSDAPTYTVTIDTVAPTVSSAGTTSETTIVITASEPLTGTPNAADFTLTGNTISTVTASGNTITITVGTAITNADTITVALGGTSVTDLAGNALTFAARTVTNNVSPPLQSTTFGGTGTGDGELNNPQGITTSSTHLLVAEATGQRVHIFDLDGNYDSKFGAPGRNDGQLDNPSDVAINSTHILVTDLFNNRVQIFDHTGNFVSKFGTSGPLDGELNNPDGITTNSTHILVIDRNNNRVQIFDYSGNYADQFGSSGSDDGQFSAPSDIVITDTNILVADERNNRVQIFDHSGNYVRQFGSGGTNNGEFDRLTGIAVTATHILTTDQENHRVQVFDLAGNYVSQFGSEGAGSNQFDEPAGITVNGDNVFVVDSENDRIHKLSLSALIGPIVVAPTVTISSTVAADSATNSRSITYTATFSSDVTEFDSISDVTLSGTATATVAAPTGSGTSYTFVVTATTDGTVIVSIPAGAAAGDGTSTNAASDTYTVTIDTVAPTFTSAATASTTTIDVIASEALAGTPTIGDFTVSDNTVSAAAISGSTITITVNTAIAFGDTPTVALGGTSVTDLAGNTFTFAARTVTNNVSAPPTVTEVTTAAPAQGYRQGEGVPIIVRFSESVTVTGTPQLTLDIGGTLVPVDIDRGSGTTDLVFRYVVAAGHNTDDFNYAGTDSLGLNGGTIVATTGGATADLTLPSPASSALAGIAIIVDTTAPTVEITSNTADNDGTAGSATVSYTATFSESVSNFVLADITVSGTAEGGSPVASNFAGSGTTYTFDVATTSDGTVVVSIPASSATDDAGNQNAVSNTYTVTVDTAALTVSISSTTAADSTTNSATVSYTATFSGTVTDFILGDITVTGTAQGGSPVASNFAGSGTDYTFDVVTTSDGTVVVSIPAGAATGAGSTNTASNTYTVTIDTVAPTVSISSSTANDGDRTNSNTILYTATFSEPVTVTDFSGFNLVGADVLLTGLSGSGTEYTFQVSYTGSADETVILSISADAITDAAGNGNTVSNTYTVTIDVTAPTFSSAGTTSPTTIDIIASEPLAGTPAAADFTLTGNTISTVTASDSTITITVGTAIINTDTITVALGGTSVTDLAGNALTFTAQTVTNNVAAGPSVSSVTASGGPYNTGDTVPITVTFSESVTVTGTPQLTLETGTTDAVVDYDTGAPGTLQTFTYTVAAGHNSNDLNYVGTDSLSLNSGTIVATTGGVAAVLTLPAITSAQSLGGSDVVIDTVAPTFSSAGTTSETTIDIVASESLTGTPAAADFTLTGNTISTVTASGSTITITVGTAIINTDTITVALGGTSVTDLAGNALAFAAQTVTNNVAAGPSVSSVTASGGPYNTGDTVPITVTFSESVTVTGTPQLTLETGTTDAVVDYDTGAPGTLQTFTYTVAAGHNSNDLNYVGTDSLSLNSGTIVATTGGVAAVLTLPATTSAQSLGGSDVVIDTIAPTFSSAGTTSSTTIDVIASEPLAGTPTIGDFTIPSNTVSTATISDSTITITVGTAITSTDTVTVALTGTSVTDLAGNALAFTAQSVTNNVPFTILFGSEGSGNAQFDNPRGITLNSTHILVADSSNDRVQIFDHSGNYASQFGSEGSGNGQFDGMRGITTNSTHILTADEQNHRVQIFDHSGNYVSQFGSDGSGDGEFSFPRRITTNSTHILVADTGNHRIQIFDHSGNYASQFGSSGSGNAQFNNPIGITTNSTHILVTDLFNHRVQIFDHSGNYVSQFGSSGSGNGQFNEPRGIRTNSTNILVVDTNNNRVQIFDHSGNYVNQLVDVFGPYDVAINGDTVFVTDTFRNSVIVFNPTTLLDVVVPIFSSARTTSATTIEISTSEPLVGSTAASEFTVSVGGTDNVVSAATFTGNTITLTVTTDIASGDAITVSYTGTVLADAAGNALESFTDQTVTNNVLLAPTVTSVTAPDGDYRQSEGIPVFVTFSEPITVSGTPQLTLDIGGTEVTVNRDRTTSTQVVFRYVVAAGHNTEDFNHAGTDSLSLNGGNILATSSGAAADLTLPATISNLSFAANDITVDTIVPTVAISSNTADNDGTAGSATVSYTVTFSEETTNFVIGDITVSGTAESGSPVASNFAGSGTTYTFDVVTTSDGTVVVSIPASSATDAAGNQNTVSNTYTVTINTAALTVSISSTTAADSATNSATISYTATFSGSVSDFVLGDITVTGTAQGGSPVASNFAGSGTTYTFDVVTTSDGTVVVSIPAGVATDAATTTNVASNTYTVTIDTTAPTFSSAGTTSTTTIDIIASESLIGTPTIGDFTVSGNTVSAATISDSTITLTVNTAIAFGDTPTVALTGTSVTDAAGNALAFTAQSVTNNVSDTTVPTVAITSTTAAGSTTNSAITYTATFSEDVTGFDAIADITLAGTATATAAAPTGTGTTYTFVVTPATDGTVIASIPADAAIDAAGNGNTASSTYTVTVDTVAPTFTSAGTTSSTRIDITASESLTGTATASDFTVSGNTVSAASISGSTITITVGTAITDTDTLTVSYTGTTITDTAGNALATFTGETVTNNISTTAPTVTSVSGADGNYRQGEGVPVTVTFSESVTVTGTPQLTLNIGGTTVPVDIDRGSGTTELVFRYVVAAGHNTDNFNYAGTDSLSLNSGTIVATTGGAAADLTLPVLTSASSLLSSNVIIDTVSPTIVRGIVTGTGIVELTTNETLDDTTVTNATVAITVGGTAASLEEDDVSLVAGSNIVINAGTPSFADEIIVTLTAVTDLAGNTLTDTQTLSNDDKGLLDTDKTVSITDSDNIFVIQDTIPENSILADATSSANATLDLSDVLADADNPTAGAVIPVAFSITHPGITIELQATTGVSGLPDSNQILISSLAREAQLSPPTAIINAAVEIGSPDLDITLSNPARITFSGLSGSTPYYVDSTGSTTEITTECANDASDTLGIPTDGECRIAVGNDLIVWTYHFTTFGAFSIPPPEPTSESRPEPRRSGGGGGSGNILDPRVCGGVLCSELETSPPQRPVGGNGTQTDPVPDAEQEKDSQSPVDPILETTPEPAPEADLESEMDPEPVEPEMDPEPTREMDPEPAERDMDPEPVELDMDPEPAVADPEPTGTVPAESGTDPEPADGGIFAGIVRWFQSILG